MKLTPKPTGHPIKLVRDRTPQVVNSTGTPGSLFYGPLQRTDDRMPLLKKKLGEEVTEFLVDGGFNELCDVYAVILGIAHAMGRKAEDLEKDLHADNRGGFFNGIVMYGITRSSTMPKKIKVTHHRNLMNRFVLVSRDTKHGKEERDEAKKHRDSE